MKSAARGCSAKHGAIQQGVQGADAAATRGPAGPSVRIDWSRTSGHRRPLWTPQFRPLIDTAKPATTPAVLRNLGPLDVVEISIRQAPANTMVDAYAVQNMTAPYGRVVKLAHLMVKGDGTAEVAAPLRFFESGFSNVVLVPAGQSPAGATTSALSVAVQVVALSGHCAMH